MVLCMAIIYLMKMNKSDIPKWFNGTIYRQGGTVTNPFSGEDYELTALELSIYDFIMGAQMTFDMGLRDPKVINDFDKALQWFQKNNIKAYMVLLD